DQEGSGVYIRRWNKDAQPLPSWYPWAKVSMSKLDIDIHDKDPGAHSSHHMYYKVCTFDTTLSRLKGNAYIIKDTDMMLLSDSYGTSNIGEEKIPVPYTGQFRFGGKLTVDLVDDDAQPHATTQWLLKVLKTNGTSTNPIYEATFNHADHTKPLPAMSWETGAIDLSYGDKISFHIQPMNDTNWATRYPKAQFVPLRSYFVMEDARTRSGTRIAESQRKLMGALYSRDAVGVNVHYSKGSTSNVRLYGKEIDTNFKPMTKA
ncbi:MAG: hypothetical protein ACRDCE_07785, partial [Cetobacterium sp.]|uniref:hypothetical protein n=1 Tax=Cetobacterium sp. TaxID=2071632 RepID=UPI003EE64311